MTRPALRVYRLLLLLFPADFRHARGAEMERLFLDMCRERRDDGRALGPTFWIPLVWDTVRHALDQRLRALVFLPRSLSMHALLTDLKSAVRSVARQPVYAAMIVFMMTLGIAGNAAVFRVFNGLFLRPLPFDEPAELVDVDVRSPRWNLDFVSVAFVDYHHWREENGSFQELGAYAERGASLAGEDAATWIEVVASTWTVPRLLGLEPVLGRLYTADEDIPDGPGVALLSRGLWERRYGGSRDVVGSTLELDGTPYEIVGVLGSDAAFVSDADVWIPLQGDPDEPGSFYLTGVGRLRPGISLEAAEADLTRIHKARIEERSVNRGTFPVVSSIRDRYLGEHRLGVGVLLGAVGIILLMACANIAGLMLARSFTRSREVGVRLALGAPRSRIVAQLLLESLLLAGVGAGLGVALGGWGSAALVEGIADEFPRWVTFELDVRFVLFTVAVTVAAALLFSLAPALRSASVSPTETLQQGSTRTTQSSGDGA